MQVHFAVLILPNCIWNRNRSQCLVKKKTAKFTYLKRYILPLRIIEHCFFLFFNCTQSRSQCLVKTANFIFILTILLDNCYVEGSSSIANLADLADNQEASSRVGLVSTSHLSNQCSRWRQINRVVEYRTTMRWDPTRGGSLTTFLKNNNYSIYFELAATHLFNAELRLMPPCHLYRPKYSFKIRRSCAVWIICFSLATSP